MDDWRRPHRYSGPNREFCWPGQQSQDSTYHQQSWSSALNQALSLSLFWGVEGHLLFLLASYQLPLPSTLLGSWSNWLGLYIYIYTYIHVCVYMSL